MIEQLPFGVTRAKINNYLGKPKLVGYQVVNNYENVFWRSYLGEAWGVYEVLRGFRRPGRNKFRAPISLIAAMCGMTETRTLTGRKDRNIPGLLDKLVECNLIAYEVRGSGANNKYDFEVYPTNLLTPEQVNCLHALIQKQHARFMSRLFERIAQIEEKRQTSSRKPLHDGEKPPTLGTAQGDPGHCPNKQYQYNLRLNNNKHEHPSQSVDLDPPTAPPPLADEVVVDFLRKIGIAKEALQSLILQHHTNLAGYVEQQRDYVDYLRETAPQRVRNYNAVLRTAIVKGWQPAADEGYKPKEQREAERAERERRQCQSQLVGAVPPRSWQDWLVDTQQLPDELVNLTDRLRAALREEQPPEMFSTVLSSMMVAGTEGSRATIALASRSTQSALSARVAEVGEALTRLLARQVEVAFEVIEKPFDEL